MGFKEINISRYVSEVKRSMNLDISDEIITKDLLLTLILAEFEKKGGVFKQLIFKGGTLLSRNYLQYHRLSEDLDFVHKDSNEIRKLNRSQREKKIKHFIDEFIPKLKEIADLLDLDFDTNRSNTKYCSIFSGRVIYTLRLYYTENNYVKIEVNFVEDVFYNPVETSVMGITDYFDSKEIMFILGLKKVNFVIPSYSIDEIILEKYRALLTRQSLKERDLFDLFLIPNSLRVNYSKVVEKIITSSLIKKELTNLIKLKINLLNNNHFFESKEDIRDLAIVKYDMDEFNKFKKDITPILINICELYLK